MKEPITTKLIIITSLTNHWLPHSPYGWCYHYNNSIKADCRLPHAVSK